MFGLQVVGHHLIPPCCPPSTTTSDGTVTLLTPCVFLGVIGLAKASDEIIDIAFDILALEALFLVPRYTLWSKLCDLSDR